MRFFMGNRGFIGSGSPVRLGDAKAFGKIEEYGTAKQITLVVGQNKGLQPKNRAGRCATQPPRFDPAQVDRAFLEIRSGQIGKPFVGATRVSGRGWYEGKPEPSVAFQVAYVPNPAEPTFAKFKANMDRMAETLAEKFCQDSVLILRDDGAKRSAASAVYETKVKRKRR